MNKRKWLSLLLAFCMIVSIVPLTFSASADETAGEAGVYYVMYGGTGDGKTADTPMSSTAAAIAAIEADDTVTEGTVYVQNNPAYEDYLPAGEKYHKYLTWIKPAEHTKPIHVVGLDADSATIIMSTDCGTAGDIVIAGPTHFSNVTLSRMRNTDEGITTGGYDVTFDSDVLYKGTSKDFYGKDIPKGIELVDASQYRFLHFGSGRSNSTGNGGRVTLNSKSGLHIFTDCKGGNYSEDATLAVDTSGNTVSIGMVRSDNNVTYGKNLNFVFGNVGNISITHATAWKDGKDVLCTGSATVVGDFQTIHPTGTTVTLPDNVTVNGNTYDLTVETPGLIDVTETSGEFSISNGTVYAYNGGTKVYYNADSTLTVPAGAWTVTSNKETATATLPLGTDKWVDDGNGTLTATPNKILNELYVMYGGTGDGETRETPLGSIADAITIINNSGAESGTIYVVDAEDAFTATVGENKVAHHFVSWPTFDKMVYHTAVITVKGADGMNGSHLAQRPNWGDNDEAYLGGPTVFEDITLFRTRAFDKTFNANGYDMTIGENVLFAGPKTDLISADNKWDGTFTNMGLRLPVGANYAPSTLLYGNDGTLTVNSAVTGTNTTIDIPAYSDDRTYTNDVNIAVNQTANNLIFLFGGLKDATFAGDLNITAKNTSAVTLKPNGDNKPGKVTVQGGFQMIVPNTTNITDTTGDYLTVNGGRWLMKTEADDMISATETAGTFTVANGKVYAYNGGSTVFYNVSETLTVPSGTWNITTDYDTAIADMVGAVDNGNGTITEDRPDRVYVSALNGNDSNDGLTSATALKTLAAAVNLIGTDRDGTVVILDGKNYEIYSRDKDLSAGYNYGPDNVTDGESIQKVALYTMNSAANRIPNHTGTITYIGEGENTDAAICFGANHMELRGPSVFKNLTLIEGYNCGKQIVTFGYPVEFDNVAYLTCGTSNKDDASTRGANATLSSKNKLNIDVSGRNKVTAKGTLVISDKSPQIAEIGVGGWDNNITISADQKVVVGSGASVDSIKLLNNNGNWTLQNINVVLNESVGKLYNRGSTGGNATVNAIQVVENNGVDVAYDRSVGSGSLTATEGVWFVKAASGITLDTTDTAGTFTSETVAYAYQPNGSAIYYGTTLTLPSGDWFVVSSLDEAIEANGTPTAPSELKKFSKWVDDGNGTVSALFIMNASEKAGVYYVMFGGTGDGKTPETAMSSTSAAIAAIEADDTVTEGTVYVMNNPDYEGNYLPAGQAAHNYATWTTPKAHTKHIRVAGLDENSSTVLMHSATCATGDFTFNGPVTFANITLARTRSCDEGLSSGGQNITLEDTVLIKGLNIDPHGNGWKIPSGVSLVSAYGSNFLKFGDGRSTPTGNGGRFEVNSKQATLIESDWHAASYSNDATLAVDTNGNNFTLNFAGDNVTYGKNLNLVLGNISKFAFNKKSASAAVTVNGDFQAIHMSGITVTLPDNITVLGDQYDLTVETKGLIDVTDKSGVYTVNGDDIVVATDVNDSSIAYPSNSGILTVPAGSYIVKKFTDEDKIVTLTFDTDYATLKGIKGQSVVLPTMEDKLFDKFMGWQTPGDETVYEGGATYAIAADSASDIAFTSVWGTFEDTVVVFVDAANGSDDNDGATASTAFATIEKGFAALNAKSESVKKLVIIGYYGFSGSLPKNDSEIIITGDGSGNSIFDMKNDYILMQGPLTLENITLQKSTTGGGKYFATVGNALTLGKNITNEYNGTKMSFRFGKSNGDMTQKPILIQSGVYGNIDLGPYYNYNNVRHTLTDSDIVIDGGSVASITLMADGYDDNMVGSDYAGHIRFTVNSGSLGAIKFATSGRASQFTDDAVFQLLNNNGTATTVSGVNGNCNNIWIVSAQKVAGCALEYTDTDGVYKVIGDKSAVAYQNNKAVAVSSRGYITIPQGSTDVKFVDKIDYLYVDDKVTFYEDMPDFDISVIEPMMIEGKVFIGWKKDGAAASKIADYVPGDVLTAEYVDVDTTDGTGDFFIVGAQIRKGSADVKQGLRFIIEKKNSLNTKLGGNIIEYGSLVLPTDLTRGHDMKYGQPLYNEYEKALPEKVSVTTWSSGSWDSSKGPSAVPAAKMFKDVDDGVWYTVCITGVDETKYDRFYTVKGYIRYNDLNGVERVAYTEYYQTSLAEIAKAAVAAGETDESITGVVDYYKNDRKTAYMAEYYDKRTDLKNVKNADGKTFQTWAETEGAANLEGITNKDFYNLPNGITVREVEYDLSNGKERKPVEIVQLGDTHLNYLNDKDWMEQSTCIMATYKGRVWNRNGASAPIINKIMQYASFFDQTVITGDIMDYFSWGCAEMVQKLIVDKDPGVLFAIGNHEPAIHMQEVEHVCNTDSSLDAVHARLSTFWPNDTKYDSKIIKNEDGIEMAMLVVIDNQAHRYQWEEIYTGLQADIEKARAKEIPILIFEHCPISTRGGAEEDLYSWFYTPGDTDTSGFDKSTWKIDLGKREAGSGSTTTSELDKRVYNLITSNADVIRGVFCGDYHNYMYTEIKGTDDDGNVKMIPQYISTANAYGGCAVKITIK